MPLNLQSQIKIVVFIPKLESTTVVRRHLKHENMSECSFKEVFMQNFLQPVRCMTVRNQVNHHLEQQKIGQIDEVSAMMPINIIRFIFQEVTMLKSVVHFTMHQMDYKLYKMHLTQGLYDEDKDLRVEMAEILLPIRDSQDNDSMMFFSEGATFLYFWCRQHA
jgi:hypothetical protein